MPDRPSFGKRGAQGGPASMLRVDSASCRPPGDADRLSAPPAAEAGAYSAASHQLDQASQRIRLAGELTALVGLMLAFVAIHFWRADPAQLKELEGRIFIPAVIAEHLPFNDPPASRTYVDMTSTEIGIDNAAIWFIALAGFLAILRERWVFAGLISGFWLIPWSLFDYHFTPAPIVLYIYAIFAFFRLYRLSWPVRLVLFPVIVLAGPMIIKSYSFLFVGALTDSDRPKAEYRMVRVSELAENQGKAARETDANGKEIVRTFTLLGLDARGPAERAAMAYVAAQEYALRGDPAAAAAALEEAATLGFAPEPYNQKRIQAIRNYVTAAGALGPEASHGLLSKYRIRLTIGWCAAAIGFLMALFGPFADVIAARMGKRARRIAEAQGRLRAERPASGQEGAVGTFGRRQGSEAIQSIATLDGEAIVGEIALRMRRYGIAAAALAALALVSFYGSYFFWLPSADSNTAFQMVALAGGAVRLASIVGLANYEDAEWARVMLFHASIVGLLGWLLFSRKHRRLVLVGVVTILAMVNVGSLALTGPAHPVSAAELDPNLRAILRQSLENTDELGEARRFAGHSLKPNSALPTFKDIARREMARRGDTARAIDSLLADDPDVVEGSVAAYTLAQIAYLEDRPAEAARMLARIANPDALTARVHRQRADLIAEWVAAKGHPLPPQARTPRLSIPMSITRQLAHALLGIGGVSVALSILPLLLLVIARKRRRRIGSLVAERRRSQMGLGLAPGG